MSLFVFGNGNGKAVGIIILINIIGSNVTVANTTSFVSGTYYYSGNGDSVEIYNLPEYGFYTIIAPKGVALDQSSNVF